MSARSSRLSGRIRRLDEMRMGEACGVGVRWKSGEGWEWVGNPFHPSNDGGWIGEDVAMDDEKKRTALSDGVGWRGKLACMYQLQRQGDTLLRC